MTHDMLEIEAKFRLHPGQRAAIERLLAGQPCTHRAQLDRYFEADGRVLRLRREGESWVITRKDRATIGPDGTKIRAEVEFPINADAVEPLALTLAWLGHRPLMTVSKERDQYELDGVSICLDRIEGLTDDFVEIEVLSEDPAARERLEAVRRRFDLADEQIELRSYAKLVADRAS